jgi:hypothetical protein
MLLIWYHFHNSKPNSIYLGYKKFELEEKESLKMNFF